MATTGAKFPTTVTSVDVSPWLDENWVNPTNVTADDTSYASVTAATFDSPDQTDALRCVGFDFSAIPDGSTIDGVIVVAGACRYANGAASIDLVKLVNSAAEIGDNKRATPVALTTSDANYTQGASNDTWNASLTAAIVKGATFGVDIGMLATAANADVFVEYVTIEVYYTAPASLVIQDGSHGHGTDGVGFTTDSSLAIADAAHAHAADAPALTVQSVLALDEAAHGHTADNLDLVPTSSTDLVIEESVHAHAAEAPTLTTDWLLTVADAAHGHAADNLTLTADSAAELVIQDSTHGHAADSLMLNQLYWVGGTGNWSDATNHWATVSGGTPGAANLPTSAHDVHFDAGSNTTNAAYTVTVNATANCKDLMFDAKPGDGLGGTITLAQGAQTINAYGSITFLAGMSYTCTAGSAVVYLKGTGTQTLTPNGVTIPGVIYNRESGTGGTTSLAGNWVSAANQSQFTHYSGTLQTNNYNITVGIFETDGTSAKTLTLGSSTITTIYARLNLGGTNLTITANTATLKLDTLAGQTLTASGSFGAMDITAAAAGSATIAGSPTFATASIVGPASKTGVVTFSGGLTVTGTFKYLGNSATNRLLIQSNTLGTARTITAAAIDAASDFCDFMDITGAGAASPFTGTSFGDCLGNSGITFTPAADQYWYTTTSGTKTWSTAGNWFLGSGGTGGAGRVPLAQDNVIFNASSIGAASTTVSADMPRIGKDITWTGVTNSPTHSFSGNPTIYGSLTLSSSINLTATGTLTWGGRSATTLTTAGKTLGFALTQNSPGGTLTLLDALTSTSNVNSNGGTFDANGFAITAVRGSFNATAAATVNMGSGVWTATGEFLFSFAAGVTVNAQTSTLKFTDATASTKTFAGGGKTYNNIELAGAGSGSFNFTGSNTFADFKVSDGAKTIKFTAGTTTTVASFTGFDTNVPTFNTVSGSGQFTLAKSGGGVVSMPGANVTNSIASPASTFYAGTAGVNGGNNTNWIFADNTSLSVAEAAHAHAADNLVLSSEHALTIAEALHAHAADNLVLDLSESTALEIADAASAHLADMPTLTAESVLAVADALHAHAADNVALSSATLLTVAEAVHAHLADTLALSCAETLAILEALHAHAAENVAFTSDSTLAIAEAWHQQLADSLDLSTTTPLEILEALHAHAGDNVSLFLPGPVIDPLYLAIIAANRYLGPQRADRQTGAVTLAASRFTGPMKGTQS